MIKRTLLIIGASCALLTACFGPQEHVGGPGEKPDPMRMTADQKTTYLRRSAEYYREAMIRQEWEEQVADYTSRRCTVTYEEYMGGKCQ